MKRILRLSVLFAILPLLVSLQWRKGNEPLNNMQVAFLADLHFHDVYAEFSDTDYQGIRNPENDRYATIRTMQSQLHSTRLFNENYFAFLAALDDIARRDVRYVILPGDFSDDGQPLHLKGLKKILDQYEAEHGMQFFLTTGNHDPVKPFTEEGGKIDFLGEGGMAQPIMSTEGLYENHPRTEHSPVITKDIRKLGYMEIVDLLGDFGFFPREDYLYWETPFSKYNNQTYTFTEAAKAGELDSRTYPVPAAGVPVPDVSYLVEPMKDLWLLAIDANVYIPHKTAGEAPGDPSNYSGASIGYNNVLSHKPHLVPWVKSVMESAEKLHKTVVVFSHYPMVDFHDDATGEIDELLKGSKMQNNRIPGETVTELFADAGIRVHFGGHIHINDTGIRTTRQGNTIVNVQIPSLAAYIPAYKLLTIKEDQHLEIETILLDSVPRFTELFELYAMEHAFLEKQGRKDAWKEDILRADNYRAYTALHLKELTRLRFIPGEWPRDFINTIMDLHGMQILELALSFNDSTAQSSTHAFLQEHGIQSEAFREWNGMDLVYDLYRLRSADRLALEDIGTARLHQYNLIMNLFLNGQPAGNTTETDLLGSFKKFASIFVKFLNGAPANHFIIDTRSGEVLEILY
ncbi:MAG: metallophosphoesterase [Bacteroidales bacterium]|nr:metallophosphoesterase [Bacteroidales bacterium]